MYILSVHAGNIENSSSQYKQVKKVKPQPSFPIHLMQSKMESEDKKLVQSDPTSRLGSSKV